MRKLSVIAIMLVAACGGSSNKPQAQKPVDKPADNRTTQEQSVAEGGAFASLTGTGDVAPDYDDDTITGGLAPTGEVKGGEPTAQGDLDKDVIRASVRQNIEKIQ